MSEVDRLSNSGLYPALPISDRRRDNKESTGGRQPGQRKPGPPDATVDTPPGPPRPPKSIIDEYC